MKSQAECYQALLDGKTLIWGSREVRLINGNQSDNSDYLADWSFSDPSDWSIKKESKKVTLYKFLMKHKDNETITESNWLSVEWESTPSRKFYELLKTETKEVEL